jgi:catechol 2,3-dioxygenase-like lactoylglutathione lyase family enzyme
MTEAGTGSTTDRAIETTLVGTGINVVDIDRAVAFYTEILGLEENGRWEFEREPVNVVEVRLGAPDRPDGPSLVLASGLLGANPPAVDTFGRLMIRVSDVEAVCAQVRERGGAVERGPSVVSGTTIIAIARDPEGVQWELFQPLEPV